MNIIFVGAGRVGKCLAPWHRSERDFVKLIRRCQKLPKENPDVLVFTTGDEDLPQAVNVWADSLPLRKSRVVLHTSGFHGLDALLPFSQRGEKVAAVHPLFSFPDNPTRTRSKRLNRAFVTHVQSRGARPVVEGLIRTWNGQALSIEKDVDRARYHAALSMAANHLTALTSISASLLRPSLGDKALLAATSLAEQVLHRIEESGPERALTGPIARGDIATVSAHWKALPKRFHSVYQALALSTIQLAKRSGNITANQANQLCKIFVK